MSSNFGVCPFCKMLIDIDACQKVEMLSGSSTVEDALQKRIDELEAENAKLKKRLIEYFNTIGDFIKYIKLGQNAKAYLQMLVVEVLLEGERK